MRRRARGDMGGRRLMHWLCGLWLVLAAGAAQAADDAGSFVEVLATPAHIAQLREGGLVIYLRHAATDAKIPDQIPVNIDDCSTQRPLSALGREQIVRLADYWTAAQIPVERVISSPFCRAQETARGVFGDLVELDQQLLYTAAMPSAEKQPAVERTAYWLSQPVHGAGYNRVVVAHGPKIAELMDYLPMEASMMLFRPLGEAQGYAYLASIPLTLWPQLLPVQDDE